MFRIDNDTAAVAAPIYPAPGTPGHFSNGNPTGGAPGTRVEDWWLDQIQEELLAVIAAAGVAPVKGTNTQVRDAVRGMIKRAGSYADTGVANAYAITPAPAVASSADLAAGDLFRFTPTHSNTAGCTLAVGGAAAAALVEADGGALPFGALVGGQPVLVVYDGAAFRTLGGRSNANRSFSGFTNFASGACTVGASGQVTLATLRNGATNFLDPNNALVSFENANGAVMQLCYSGSTGLVAALSIRLQSTAPVAQGFFYQGSNVGNITLGTTSTSYGTTSDERFKDFDGPLDPQLAIEIIRTDPVRAFRWNARTSEPGKRAVGWGAQTSYAVSEDLASPGGWFLPEIRTEPVYGPARLDSETGTLHAPELLQPETVVREGRPAEEGEDGAVYRPWTVDQSKRTPYLWAAVAWLLDERDALRAEMDALKALLAA